MYIAFSSHVISILFIKVFITVREIIFNSYLQIPHYVFPTVVFLSASNITYVFVYTTYSFLLFQLVIKRKNISLQSCHQFFILNIFYFYQTVISQKRCIIAFYSFVIQFIFRLFFLLLFF